MAKGCVFCGEKPNSKTNEHVLPQWLIELTGDPKRVVRLAFNRGENSKPYRKFSFNSFKFPACESCNSASAELENNTKPIVLKMLSHDGICAAELVILLDWFDKIRIGLWLAYYYLHKNEMGITPNFYISQRMRMYDRMLLVCKASDPPRGLSSVGCETPGFGILPSCFCLIINDLYFMNISYPFLFSHRLGFPYPQECYFTPNSNRLAMTLVSGRERLMRPLIRKPFLFSGTQFYQPMFFMPNAHEWLYRHYDTTYIRERCLDWDKGIGKVIYRKGNDYLPYPDDPSEDWIPDMDYPYPALAFHMQLEVLEWQLYLLKMLPSLERLPAEERRERKRTHRTCIRYNTEVANILRRKAKKLNVDVDLPT